MKKEFWLLVLVSLLLSASCLFSQSEEEEDENYYYVNDVDEYYYIDADEQDEHENRDHQTLLKHNDNASHSWAALDFKFGGTSKQNITLIGFKGGFMLGRYLTLGIAGNSALTSSSSYMDENDSYNLSSSSLGLYGGIIFFPRSIFHVNVNCIFGNEWASEGKGGYYNSEKNSDWVFLEPGLVLSINVTNWFQIDLGASYRLEGSSVTSDMMLTNIAFKFGVFN